MAQKTYVVLIGDSRWYHLEDGLWTDQKDLIVTRNDWVIFVTSERKGRTAKLRPAPFGPNPGQGREFIIQLNNGKPADVEQVTLAQKATVTITITPSTSPQTEEGSDDGGSDDSRNRRQSDESRTGPRFIVEG